MWLILWALTKGKASVLRTRQIPPSPLTQRPEDGKCNPESCLHVFVFLHVTCTWTIKRLPAVLRPPSRPSDNLADGLPERPSSVSVKDSGFPVQLGFLSERALEQQRLVCSIFREDTDVSQLYLNCTLFIFKFVRLQRGQ